MAREVKVKMGKTILKVCVGMLVLSAFAVIVGLVLANDRHSFESGAAVAFYGFVCFLAAGLLTLIVKISVSQRG